MIFCAVGTQLPFDRLAESLDQWCAESGRGKEVFGQVGKLGAGHYRPQHFQWQPRIEPDEFSRRIETADVIVSHAGMGTIITALYLQKPIIIMARRAHLGEQRNDHQFATLKRFKERPGVHAVETSEELAEALDHLLIEGREAGGIETSRFADERLTSMLRDFIHER